MKEERRHHRLTCRVAILALLAHQIAENSSPDNIKYHCFISLTLNGLIRVGVVRVHSRLFWRRSTVSII